MKMIERNHYMISGNKDLETLYSFKDFPIFMGCVDTSIDEDIKTNMNWWISKNGCIQLNPLIPLEVLYKDSHGSGTTGKLWDVHHKEFAEFINKFSIMFPLEIGAGHGNLARDYIKLRPNTKWTIIDPSPNIKSNNNIRVMENGFFDSGFKSSIKFDAVIHSHVIEHVYDPYGFIKDISGIIDIGNWHIFSIPNLKVMLEKKYTNCLNFEHTIFITESFVEYWLKKTGFEIIKKKYFMDDHSIFYATYKSGYTEKPEIPDEYDINKELFMEFIQFHKKLIHNLNNKMDGFDGKVYLFGGHIFAQYLIGFGLNTDKIECIIDNDSNKQGKRLYGTSLIVRSPKILKGMKDVAIILRAGGYNNEIKDDIIENINNNVIFWE